MTTVRANLLNSFSLIILGFWGYYDTFPDPESWTPLIPVIFGVVLLLCNSGIKKENKLVAHIAVVLTLLILIALCFRLPKTEAGLDQYRVLAMIVTSGIAMGTFIKSFIDARKKKVQQKTIR